MALKDKLFSAIDNLAHKVTFDHKEPDAKALRAPLLKGIKNTKDQFENGRTKAPNKWWQVSNGIVAITVKLRGDTLELNGVQTNHMPVGAFSQFLDDFRATVEAGEFDEELKNHGRGDAQVAVVKEGSSRRGSISTEAAKERGRVAAGTRKRNREKAAQEAAGQ